MLNNRFQFIGYVTYRTETPPYSVSVFLLRDRAKIRSDASNSLQNDENHDNNEKHDGWLPLCLTHPSYSGSLSSVAHYLRATMQENSMKTERRRQDRIPAVLPVRVRGKDSSGASFDELAHTLDLTPMGVRLGSIRHELKALDTLVILYRQRRMEFKVVWTKLLDGKHEYQVGLQAFSQEKELWGMSLVTSAVSGAA
jgi:hypothetical protein